MPAAGAKFEILYNDDDGPLVIRDVGHEEGRMTVTNDVDRVVLKLVEASMLRAGRRLLYFDSDDRLDEIKHDGIGFRSFFPATAEDRRIFTLP